MNKLLAVLLLVAVPALAQQQISLVPQTQEVEPAADAVKTGCDAFPWRPVAIAAGATLAAATVIAIVFMVAASSASKPIMKSDFNCGAGGCDAYINAPQQ